MPWPDSVGHSRPAPLDEAYSALILSEDSGADRKHLAELRADPATEIHDHRELLAHQYELLYPRRRGGASTPAESFRWAYYPWRRALVSVLGPADFRRLRLDRNRQKITEGEQQRFLTLRVGVVGLSVGHAIAYTLALEGLCGFLRLADFDRLELSNLNRIPATILDLGMNKAVVAARRIAELDPYLQVDVQGTGVDETTIDSFLDGLNLVIEECDSLDIKILVRQIARARGIPVLMETSDRGLLDVERFDEEPHRPLFHGLLGDIEPGSLRGLSMTDKAPHVMRILEAEALSARMAASMVEIDRTVSSWPQLAGDVQLGGATVAAAVRRLGRAEKLESGRIRIDLDDQLNKLGSSRRAADGGHDDPSDARPSEPASDVHMAIIEAVRLAPSGGNAQPWKLDVTASSVDIILDTERSVCMDVAFRGSYVAIGAAEFNARVAAAKFSALGSTQLFPGGLGNGTVVRLNLGNSTDDRLAALFPAMLNRMSNRSLGRRERLTDDARVALVEAAAVEGATLKLICDSADLRRLGHLLAASDRIRYLTPTLHGEMFAELRWPGDRDLQTGIDVRTLGLDAADLAKLEVARRSEVMAHLADWDAGHALGDTTFDRTVSSSAVGVITVRRDTGVGYLAGGAAVERCWITANTLGLGVYPMSPVFLYARSSSEHAALSHQFSDDLEALQQELRDIVGLDSGEVPVLVLRLAHRPETVPRSRRRPIAELLTPAGAFLHQR